MKRGRRQHRRKHKRGKREPRIQEFERHKGYNWVLRAVKGEEINPLDLMIHPSRKIER